MQDNTVSQMQNYLAQKGYNPPAPQPSQNDWHSLITQPSSAQPATAPSGPSAASQIAGNLGNTFSQGGTSLMNDISGIGKNVQAAGGSPLAGIAAAGTGLGHVAGDIAGTAGGILGSFLTPFLPDSVKNGIGDATKAISDRVNSIPGMTPDIAKSLGDVFNTLTLKGGAEAEAPLKSAAATAATKGTEAIGGAAQAIDRAAAPVISKIGTATSDLAGKVKGFVSPSMTPEESVGKIIQGKISDIPAAQRTFAALPSDAGKVENMTPKDLSVTLDSKLIKPNIASVDAQFAKDTSGGKSIKSFTQTVGEGKSAVKVNHVQNAIDELKAHYAATGDAKGLSEMKALENKAKINGLTSQAVNNLAKLHGSEIKTFSPITGQAASGLSKQAAESTRTGLKSTARNELAKVNPEAAREAARLDKQTSEALNTKRLLDKQTEKANASLQKNGKESGLSKAFNSKTGKVVKTIAKYGIGGEIIKHGLGL